MRNKASFLGFALSLVILMLSYSCKRDDPIVMPTLTTADITEITLTSAVSGGIITDDGGDTVSACGICWSTNRTPTTDDSKTMDDNDNRSFNSDIKDLTIGTTYYVRAYATNSVGTSYGNELSFTTEEVVVDADGNIYNVVTIGTQIWMAENLKTTKYNDGTDIQLVTDNAAWWATTNPAYCWYDNDSSAYAGTYGALYNWQAVNTGKLCPEGWHVPTDMEWFQLENYLNENGYNYDGATSGRKIAKSLASTTLWNLSSTTGAIGNTDYPTYRNKSGFTALPGGSRNGNGFESLGRHGAWWTSTQRSSGYALSRLLDYDVNTVFWGQPTTKTGLSVRCLRDKD